MIRKIIATTALSGMLALGSVGVASAATTGSTGSGAGANVGHRHFTCAQAPAALAKINAAEAKLAQYVPAAQARLAKAQAANQTKVVARIQRNLNRAQALETKGQTLEAKINAKCSGTTPVTGSTPSTPAS